MKRFVYSPKVEAWVKTSQGIVELTPYIVSGSVTRRVNQISSAELVIRNPDFRWTQRRTLLRDGVEEVMPVFHPMDPIIITLTRIKDRPIQVFTGYLDTTPYLQLFPGTCTLKASCTLKRLLHTYFDPALPYMLQFLQKYGWVPTNGGQIISPSGSQPTDDGVQSDATIGKLLEATLIEIGGWEPENIHIGKIPQGLAEKVTRIAESFKDESIKVQQEIDTLLRDIIGVGSYGSGSVTSGGSTTSGSSESPSGNIKDLKKIVCTMKRISDKYGIPPELTIAVWQIEQPSLKDDPGNPHYGYFQQQIANPPYAHGTMSKKAPTIAETHDLNIATEGFASAAAAFKSAFNSSPQGMLQWAMKTQGVNCGNNPVYCRDWSRALQTAKSFLAKYDCSSDSSGTQSSSAPAPVDGNAGTQDHKSATRSAPIATAARAADPPPQNVTSSTGTQGRSKKSGTNNPDRVVLPVPAQYVDYNNFGEQRPGHLHDGEDFGAPCGTPVHAVKAGKVIAAGLASGYGGYVRIQHPDGYVTGYAHLQKWNVTVGQSVDANDVIGISGGQVGMFGAGDSQGCHLHFNVSKSASSSAYSNNIAPKQYLAGAAPPNNSGSSSGGTSGGGSAGNPGSSGNLSEIIPRSEVRREAKAAAFAALLEFPSLAEQAEAILLTGKRSLLNDKPLLPFIQQLSNACLRSFMSLPNGDFFAFYPDYFGGLGRQPYWIIDDIEIMDGNIQISDDALATHVFVVGDTSAPFAGLGGDGIDWVDRVQTSGVVTLQEAFQSDFINLGRTFKTTFGHKINSSDPGDLPDDVLDVTRYEDAIAFLQRFGARPKEIEQPMIRNRYYEMFAAYQTFCLMWSQQFLTDFRLTFMPELFPGGIVGFPNHDMQCYVDEVTHTFSYEEGFHTDAKLMAPASTDQASDLGINYGLIRRGALSPPDQGIPKDKK